MKTPRPPASPSSPRRLFLRQATVGAAAVAGFPAVLRSAAARRDRPNLLFLWTDQQRADTLACEQRNLFYRDGHREVIARLTKEIHVWQKRTGDKLAL